MRTIQPREVDAVPSANFQFLSSSGITQGSNSTLLTLITDLVLELNPPSPKQLLDDLVGALDLFLELLWGDEVFLVAGLVRHDARKLRRCLDTWMSREVFGIGHDLLAFLAEDEVGQQHRRVWMLRAFHRRKRARGARHRIHELRIDRRALAGADQGMMGIDVDC